MAEATFPERRTRSQLTLPDNILTIPERSPLKGARTALRKHINAASGKDESDDELFLSPGKPQPHMKASNVKRSASPTSQDEYRSSPPEGRELKRIRYGGAAGDEQESSIGKSQRLTGHSRTYSDSNIILAGHSNDKGLSPKPVPAHAPTKNARATSEPIIFPASQNIPHIDFRHPPRSPKRTRSRSRSPSKDRAPKLRVTPIFGLSTIRDDVDMNMHESDIPNVNPTNEPLLFGMKNVDVTRPENEIGIPEASGTPSGHERIQSSTSPREVIPASPPREEMTAGQLIPSFSAPSPGEIIPPSPPAYYKPVNRPTIFKTLATPATHSLDKLMPMSPLTPLPETPLPAKFMPNAGTADRSAENAGWGIVPMRSLTLRPELTRSAIASSVSQSRLPRPLMAPPMPPSKHLQSAMAMDSSVLPIGKNVVHAQRSNSKKTVANTASSSAPKKDAFALMMQRPLEQKARLEVGKSKVNDKGTKAMSLPPPLDKGQDTVANGSSLKPKTKLKEKMRPRQKQEVKPTFPIVLSSGEDEEMAMEGQEGQNKETNFTGGGDDDDTSISDTGKPVDDPVPEALAEAANVADDEITDDARKMASLLDQLTPAGADAPPQQPQESEIHEPSLDNPISPQIDTHLEYNEPLTLPPATESSRPEIPASDAADTGIETQPLKLPVEEASQEIPQPQPSSQPGKNNPSLGKKRQPAIPLPSRVTRSASNQNNSTIEVAQGGSSSKRVVSLRSAPAAPKRPASGSLKKRGPAPIKTVGHASGSDMAIDSLEDNHKHLPPGSPMRISPAKSSPGALATSKTDEQVTTHVDMDTLSSISTPTKLMQHPPSPSPTKIARSTLLAMRPTAASIARTFSSSSLHTAPNSSLSTLSSALEKLRMPAPSRPSTSMGFNHDSTGDDDDRAPARSKDDVTIGRTSVGLARKAGSGIQRSNTVGSSSFKSSGNTSLSKPSSSTSAKLVQKPLSMFMAAKGGLSKHGAGAREIGPFGKKPSLFGIAGGPRRTVSKKSTLPVVIGSPVKGGAACGRDEDETVREDENAGETNDDEVEIKDGGKIFNAIINGGSATELMANLLAQGPEKGRERESAHRPVHSSRRVSMLSRDLSYSLNTMPPPAPASSGARGTMGPPATPPKAGRVDINPGSGGSGSSTGGSPSQAGPSGARRSSARIANAAPAMKAKANIDGLISAGKKAAAVPANPAKMILKDCVIFVDVKSEDGDEAGLLFIEMLEGVGARVLTRVGQSCTHIVFKNGLTSTITRYKLLRDPKPLVVGIGWVVECIERRAQVDETDFLIDLDRVNVAGHNKRRRSILPKLFAEEEPSQDEIEGDRSMDGSVSSITMDDDLTPLEKALRRKNKLAGRP